MLTISPLHLGGSAFKGALKGGVYLFCCWVKITEFFSRVAYSFYNWSSTACPSCHAGTPLIDVFLCLQSCLLSCLPCSYFHHQKYFPTAFVVVAVKLIQQDAGNFILLITHIGEVVQLPALFVTDHSIQQHTMRAVQLLGRHGNLDVIIQHSTI